MCEAKQRLFGVLVIDAEPALHRHRDLDFRLHGRNAIADQGGLDHQAGAEAAFLHPVGWAPDIDVDLVIAEFLADTRRLRQGMRIAAAELERYRMFEGIKAPRAARGRRAGWRRS